MKKSDMVLCTKPVIWQRRVSLRSGRLALLALVATIAVWMVRGVVKADAGACAWAAAPTLPWAVELQNGDKQR